VLQAVPVIPGDRQGEGAVDAVLSIVRERTGVDFARYRRATIERRIANRMISTRTRTIADYLQLLHTAPEETVQLLERLTIKVSRFYRNAVTFDCLRETVLPGLAAARQGEPLRIWSVGCAHGEEPWTLAMLLEEAGIAGTVLATDIDELALQRARAALYREEALAELPAALRRFTAACGPHTVAVPDALRARVRFARHDITAGQPLEEEPFDLVCCRNVLIYLQREAQEAAGRVLRGSLVPGGVLCLGEAEWLPPFISPSFDALPNRTRLFRYRPEPTR
jgi:chemotaxis methyl-accepting protein methylase